jgi:hypothetical protein
MTTDLKVKRGDTYPSITATLRSAPTAAQRADGHPGDPVGLEDATVELVVYGSGVPGPELIGCTITDAKKGVVRVGPLPATVAAGSYWCDFRVTREDGTRQSIPSDGYLELVVIEPPKKKSEALVEPEVGDDAAGVEGKKAQRGQHGRTRKKQKAEEKRMPDETRDPDRR